MPISRTEGILTHDYMNLILVASGLKPGTETGFSKCYGHDCDTPRLRSIEEERKEYAPEKRQRMIEYQDTIKKFPLIYSLQFPEHIFHCDRLGCGGIFFNEGVQFYVARDRQSLDRLLKAKDHYAKGAAYGFPKEAIDAFADPDRKGYTFAADMFMNIEKAMEAGIHIPSWIAYLSHVPEKTDFLHNDVSESSRILGERYQSFIRQNYPDIALKVEEDFMMRFPKKTYIDDKGAVIMELRSSSI